MGVHIRTEWLRSHSACRKRALRNWAGHETHERYVTATWRMAGSRPGALDRPSAIALARWPTPRAELANPVSQRARRARRPVRVRAHERHRRHALQFRLFFTASASRPAPPWPMPLRVAKAGGARGVPAGVMVDGDMGEECEDGGGYGCRFLFSLQLFFKQTIYRRWN